MTKVRAALFCFSLAVIFIYGSPCTGQVAIGTPPMGSFGGGPDVIDLGNLNAHLTIPVIHKAGRGLSFAYDLSYDSSIWMPVTSSGTTTWKNMTDTTWGWTTSIPRGGHVSYHFSSIRTQSCTVGRVNELEITTTYSSWTYYDGFGTPHPIPGDSTTERGCTSDSGGFTATASDGSGYTMTVNGTTVTSLTARDGAIINPVTGALTLQDRNGNQITETGGANYYDTLSSTTPVLTIAGSGTPASPITYTYTAPSGAPASYKMIYTAYTVQTAFQCSGVVEYPPTSNNLVSEIDLADNLVNPNDKYTFAYEATPGDTHTPHYVTGRIASITLPTGGQITYSYPGANDGIECGDGSTANLTRVTPDGTWKYSRTGSGSAWTTIVTDPSSGANQTVINFQEESTQQNFYETERQVYAGSSSSGTLLETFTTCYNGSTLPCNATAVALPIARRNISRALANGLTSEHDDFWNANGGPTETDDYDWGTAPHGSLLKKVLATYAALGNITSFRQTVSVQNSSGTTVSQITYNYDETTPTSTSGTPQHVSVSSPRGNLTSTKTYINATATLNGSSTYYDTGNVEAITDVNQGVTSHNYASGATSCYNSFATSVTEAITTLSKSMTWNCGGGVQLTSTDENNQVTTTSYADPYFWRPVSVTDPTGALTSYCYGLLMNSTCTPNPNQTESTLTVNPGSSAVDTLVTLDSLGRIRTQQRRQAPGSSNFDTTETDYDSLGRISRVTLPYVGTQGLTNSSVAATTTTYDAMSRPLVVQDGGGGSTNYNYGQGNDVLVTRSPAPNGENTKRRQNEYDGIGRLSSVCEITAGTTSWPGGTCAQITSQTGYWTKYSYDPIGNLTSVNQNAQMSGSTQSRAYTYDWMRRMTSETVPEIGTSGNGVANYTYDSDSTCGNYAGDLVKKLDAAGNTICMSYDLLHRQLTSTYPSGIYSSVTPQKHFVYDGATVNGQTMLYAKARLAEAYTCYSPCSTKTTDNGLSYTILGQGSDSYESTPNSNGYYHTSQSYWPNSLPYQLTSSVGIPTITYGPDGEGRLGTVSASSGQNPVASTSYNPASQPTAISLGSGSGDADNYSYDQNTNRMTQYKFTVNGMSLTGNLGWNANGTVQTQSITDGFNSADTQNCSYGYDDITRLTGASCGSAAAQTFSYDPFGNINKSGSPYSFQPSYSASTNRMTQVVNFTPTYDSDGNVTNDNFHSYTWDAEGHAITIDAGQSDAVSLTYDALGRMAEQTRSGAYIQIVYSAYGGKFALMSGQTLQKAIVPLSAKSLAVYSSGGLQYYAHPDSLGSIRLGTTPGRMIDFDVAYAPFGETYVPTGTVDAAYTGMMNDTAHRQDSAGGLYDFPVREYSTQGRWPSPDPTGVAATCPMDPQTQNRYAYVRNNPMSFTDPTGADETGNCGPDDWGDPSCGPGGGGGGGGGCDPDDPFCPAPPPQPGPPGGGGNPEQPRAFPWPLLPPGFFNSLENSGGGPNRWQTCKRTILDPCLNQAEASNAECNLNGALKCLAGTAACVGICKAEPDLCYRCLVGALAGCARSKAICSATNDAQIDACFLKYITCATAGP